MVQLFGQLHNIWSSESRGIVFPSFLQSLCELTLAAADSRCMALADRLAFRSEALRILAVRVATNLQRAPLLVHHADTL